MKQSGECLMSKLINVGMFARIKGDDFKEYGVGDGDIIYIAGDTVVSVEEKDPYALRRVFVAAYTKDGHIQIALNPFIVDAKRLKAVSKGEQKSLDEIKEKDFGGDVEQPTIH
jgi:hypothetical protein